MIRFLSRSAGFVLLAAAFAALVVDGSRSIAGGRPLFYSLGDGAAWLGGVRYDAALAGVPGWPAPAQRVAVDLLAMPGALVAGLAGLLLLYGGRPPAADFYGRRT